MAVIKGWARFLYTAIAEVQAYFAPVDMYLFYPEKEQKNTPILC